MRVEALDERAGPVPEKWIVTARRLNPGSGAGRPAWIGILSEEGLRALRRRGHRALAGGCAPELPADAVRFVDASHGPAFDSSSDRRAAALFESPFPELPVVIASSDGHGSAELELSIQPDLACLRGHFPALPLVPGAAQLGWALAFAAEKLGLTPHCRALRAVKFERIIQPGHRVFLHIERSRDSSILRFRYVSGSGRHSQGRIETGAFDG